MAEKRFCDRCEKELNIYNIENIRLKQFSMDGDIEAGFGSVDLCEACFKLFEQFMKPFELLKEGVGG